MALLMDKVGADATAGVALVGPSTVIVAGKFDKANISFVLQGDGIEAPLGSYSRPNVFEVNAKAAGHTLFARVNGGGPDTSISVSVIA